MVAISYPSEVWGAQADPKLKTTLDSNLELRSKCVDHVTGWLALYAYPIVYNFVTFQ